MLHITSKQATKENEDYLIKYYTSDDYQFIVDKNKRQSEKSMAKKSDSLVISESSQIDKEFNQAKVYDEKDIVVPEEKGFWGGQLAGEMFLSGQVDADDFRKLFSNINPSSDLTMTKVTRKERRAGYDITFDINKSLSIAALVYDDTRIIRAFEDSVEYTMKYIEKDIKTRVRQERANYNRQTGNAVYAKFTHYTNRPVKKACDPQLHAHVFLFNCTYDHSERAYKAIQMGDIKSLGNYYNAIFTQYLANRTKQLGYEIEWDGKRGFEIQGISKNTIKEFSKRSEEIEAVAKLRGVTSTRKKAQIGKEIRANKDYDKSMEEIRKDWLNMSSTTERELIEKIKLTTIQRKVVSTQEIDEQNKRLADYIRDRINHNFETRSAISKYELYEDLFNNCLGELYLPPSKLDQEVEMLVKNSQLIIGEYEQDIYYTTPRIISLEKEIVDWVNKYKGQQEAINELYILSTPVGWSYQSEQIKAVQGIVQNRDRVVLLDGKAGTGKTTTLSQIKLAVQQSGKEVIALAPTHKAVDVLSRDGFEAFTLDHFLNNYELQNRLNNGVVILDEAGLASTIHFSKYRKIADQQNIKTVLSGDFSQHKSIQGGEILRLIKEKANVETYTLTDVKRQKSEQYREVVKDFIDKDIKAGFKKMLEYEMISEIPVNNQRVQSIAELYVSRTAISFKEGKPPYSCSIACTTHEDANLINDTVRETMKEKGLIDHKSRSFKRYQSLGLTEQEKSNPRYIKDGVILIVDRQIGQLKKGEKYQIRVKGESKDRQIWLENISHKNQTSPVNKSTKTNYPFESAKYFTLYKEEDLYLSKGDLVMFCKTKDVVNPDTGSINQIRNGSLRVVDGFTSEGNIRLKGGTIIDKDWGFLKHGYANTTYSLQGTKFKEIIGSFPTVHSKANSYEAGYVFISRGENMSHIFTDDTETLRRQFEKSSKKINALELDFKQNKGIDNKPIVELKKDKRGELQKLPTKELEIEV